MSEQYGDPLDGDASQQQLGCKGIAKSVCMAVRYLCNLKELTQALLPATNHAVQIITAIPKKVRKVDERRSLECSDNKVGQDRVYRNARFLSVHKQFVPANLVAG